MILDELGNIRDVRVRKPQRYQSEHGFQIILVSATQGIDIIRCGLLQIPQAVWLEFSVECYEDGERGLLADDRPQSGSYPFPLPSPRISAARLGDNPIREAWPPIRQTSCADQYLSKYGRQTEQLQRIPSLDLLEHYRSTWRTLSTDNSSKWKKNSPNAFLKAIFLQNEIKKVILVLPLINMWLVLNAHLSG
jgi:hypothetical protein